MKVTIGVFSQFNMFAGTALQATKTSPATTTTTIVKQTCTSYLYDFLNSYVIFLCGICDMQHLHNCWQHQRHHQKIEHVLNFMNDSCILDGCWHIPKHYQQQQKHFMFQNSKRKNILLFKKFKKSITKTFKGTTIVQRRTSSICCGNMMRGNMMHGK